MQINSKLKLNILKKINSEGVNSVLYLVEDIQLGEQFIVKQISKSKFKNTNKYFEESKKMNKLKHPNIINIKQTSYDDEYIYITMPYMQNGSINSLIYSKYLTVREIIKYSLGFLSAIYYIHMKGILHCDIKPNNILLNEQNEAILTDFGSAIYVDEQGKSRLRNVYYKHIAPEQCISPIVDHKVDIYQIGTTLYRMCNGNEEYNKQAKRYKDLNDLKIACGKGKFPVRKKYLPHIPKSLIKVIEKCIEVNPKDRYENVLQIMNDISEIVDNLDWQYEKIDLYLYKWKESNIEIILKKEANKWLIKTYYNSYEDKYIEVESKAQGYRYVRKIINEHKKSLT